MSATFVNLDKIIDAVGEGINVAHEIIVDKAGVFDVFKLTDEVSALSSIPKGAVLSELKSLDVDGRKELDARFAAKVSLSDKALEAKIEKGELTLEHAIDVVYQAIDVVTAVEAIVNEVKSIFA